MATGTTVFFEAQDKMLDIAFSVVRSPVVEDSQRIARIRIFQTHEVV